jgi:hypothetical protein
MHHALMNVCHPVFERFQISGSYATRPGKGQYAALEHAKILVRRHPWFGKFDVRKYFDSIDHETLYDNICRLFKDPLLLKIFRSIIDSYAATPGRGLPIGNLTSQYFANYYLAYADHFAKEKLQSKAYLRYMDDTLFFHDDKDALIEMMKRFNTYVDGNLHLCLKPACINSVSKGVPFLGYTLFPRHVRLSRISRKRFVKKYAACAGRLACGTWTEREYAGHLCPLIAFTRYADARHFRQAVSQRMEASPKVRTAFFAAAVGTATGTSTTPRTAALPTVTTTTPTTATTTSGFVLCFILSSKSPVDAGQDEPVCSTLFPRDE